MNSFFRHAKIWATSQPTIYQSYCRLFKPSLAKYLPNSGTDLFISGYPRSGNDYLKQLTKSYNSEIKISSHFHKVGAFKLALKLSVPVVAVIRDPIESISSSMVKYKEELKLKEFPIYPIFDYVFFHKELLKNRDQMTIISFEATINDPIYYYSKLENELGIHKKHQIKDIDLTVNKINEKLNNANMDHNRIDALKKGPDQGKELLKSKAKVIIDENKKVKDKALRLYDELIKYT